MYIDKCADMSRDMRTDMCIDLLYGQVCMDKCAGMYIDVCAEMRIRPEDCSLAAIWRSLAEASAAVQASSEKKATQTNVRPERLSEPGRSSAMPKYSAASSTPNSVLTATVAATYPP